MKDFNNTKKYLCAATILTLLMNGTADAAPPAPLSDVKVGEICMSLLGTDLQHVRKFDSSSTKNSYLGTATHTLKADKFGYIIIKSEVTNTDNCQTEGMDIDIINLSQEKGKIGGEFCLRTGRDGEALAINLDFYPELLPNLSREGKIVSFQYCSLRNREAILNGRDALWGGSLIARTIVPEPHAQP